ncbi:hypothetical protein EDD22DRAFT_1048046 [Suillus occidentalis]|nr:hypothetical protein EDD22DRAFT_1048046 [Suillus occidentalis]
MTAQGIKREQTLIALLPPAAMSNSQRLSLRISIGARVDDSPHRVKPSQRNSHSTRLGPLGKGKQATTGHAVRHLQAKQDSSFVPAPRQPSAFSPGTVTQEWNNHTYGISATVSISQQAGSPAVSDTGPMSVDDGPPSSSGKWSTKISLDSSPLTGIYSKASPFMSVDPAPLNIDKSARRKAPSPMSVDQSPPNIDKSARRKASSPMLVDLPSARRSQGSSDRMLIDKIQHHYSTQNLPQQVYGHGGLPFSISTPQTISPTMTYSRNTPVHSLRERTLASSASLPTSFSLQHISPRPCTSQPPPSPIHSSLAHPPGRSELSPAAPPKTFPPKHGIPASRQGNRTSPSHIHARGSSSEDHASDKHHCVRPDSQPIALLSTDFRSARGTSPQSPQSLSPINEAWLPPMEKQLEMAHRSQLKARFRKFKAIIGGAVNEIKEAIVPYHKNHRKYKVARTNTDLEPFSGVPDYLRSLERYPSKTTPTTQSQLCTAFNIGNDIDHIAQSWTKLTLCDSPTAMRGNDGLLKGEAPHLSSPPPRTNKPPMSRSRSPRIVPE